MNSLTTQFSLFGYSGFDNRLDETLSEFEVGKLIDMNNFTSIEKAITKLINNAFEEGEEDDKETSQVKNEQPDHQTRA